MQVSTTELRSNLYKFIDYTLETGETIEIKRHGRVVKLTPDAPISRLINLRPHPNTIHCSDEELIYNNWISEWKDDLS